MARFNNPGMILLGIWLVAQGLVNLIGFTFQGLGVILALLALAAGVLLLIGARRWRSNLGLVLLSIWLILTGLFALIGFTFQGSGVLMALLALAAGVLLLLRR
jgi:hypothetical protein